MPFKGFFERSAYTDVYKSLTNGPKLLCLLHSKCSTNVSHCITSHITHLKPLWGQRNQDKVFLYKNKPTGRVSMQGKS